MVDDTQQSYPGDKNRDGLTDFWPPKYPWSRYDARGDNNNIPDIIEARWRDWERMDEEERGRLKKQLQEQADAIRGFSDQDIRIIGAGDGKAFHKIPADDETAIATAEAARKVIVDHPDIQFNPKQFDFFDGVFQRCYVDNKWMRDAVGAEDPKYADLEMNMAAVRNYLMQRMSISVDPPNAFTIDNPHGHDAKTLQAIADADARQKEIIALPDDQKAILMAEMAAELGNAMQRHGRLHKPWMPTLDPEMAADPEMGAAYMISFLVERQNAFISVHDRQNPLEWISKPNWGLPPIEDTPFFYNEKKLEQKKQEWRKENVLVTAQAEQVAAGEAPTVPAPDASVPLTLTPPPAAPNDPGTQATTTSTPAAAAMTASAPAAPLPSLPPTAATLAAAAATVGAVAGAATTPAATTPTAARPLTAPPEELPPVSASTAATPSPDAPPPVLPVDPQKDAITYGRTEDPLAHLSNEDRKDAAEYAVAIVEWLKNMRLHGQEQGGVDTALSSEDMKSIADAYSDFQDHYGIRDPQGHDAARKLDYLAAEQDLKAIHAEQEASVAGGGPLTRVAEAQNLDDTLASFPRDQIPSGQETPDTLIVRIGESIEQAIQRLQQRLEQEERIDREMLAIHHDSATPSAAPTGIPGAPPPSVEPLPLEQQAQLNVAQLAEQYIREGSLSADEAKSLVQESSARTDINKVLTDGVTPEEAAAILRKHGIKLKVTAQEEDHKVETGLARDVINPDRGKSTGQAAL